MYFDSVGAVLFMDGHGAYVWTAYLVTAVVIALILLPPARRRRRLLREIAARSRGGEAAGPAGDREAR